MMIEPLEDIIDRLVFLVAEMRFTERCKFIGGLMRHRSILLTNNASRAVFVIVFGSDVRTDWRKRFLEPSK